MTDEEPTNISNLLATYENGGENGKRRTNNELTRGTKSVERTHR